MATQEELRARYEAGLAQEAQQTGPTQEELRARYEDGLAQEAKSKAQSDLAKHKANPPPDSTMMQVIGNAASKGAAGIPDMLLNAPNRVINLGKAVYGMGTNLAGRPDLSPDLSDDPDLTRRGMEAIGIINPNVQPKGALQKAADVLTQGLVGGALTGGSSIPRMMAGAGLGALSSGTGAAVEEVTGDPALGVSAGMLVPHSVGAALSPKNIRPNVRLLANEGVQMTPGEILGGAFKRNEEFGQRVPVLSDAINAAKREGQVSLNTAGANRALKPIGEKLPDGLEGHVAIDYIHNTLSDAYQSLLPKMKGELDATQATGKIREPLFKPSSELSAKGQQSVNAAKPVLSLRQELDNIRKIGENLPEKERGQLNRIIDNEVVNRFTKDGLASGETLKNIESQLGEIGAPQRRSTDYDVRALGGAVQEVQAALRRMVANVNPDHSGELSKINEGYANFKRMQKAAANIGAKNGVATPAQMHRAVEALDKSKDKARFSEGKALMQDLTLAGKDVMSPTVPDSGSPWGLLMAHAVKNPFIGTAGALASVPYLPFIRRPLQSIMTSGNQGAAKAARRSIIPLAETTDDRRGALSRMVP
jgi:hypothetical protein